MQDEVTKVFKPIVQPLNKTAEKSISSKQQDHSTAIKSKNSLFSIVQDDEEDDDYDEESEDSQKSEPQSQFYDTEQNLSPTFRDALHSTQHEHVLVKDSTSLAAASSLDNVVQKYLNDILEGDFHSDNSYGVRKLTNGYKFGNDLIHFTTDKINIGDKQYDQIAGLIELLFMKKPNKNPIENSDIAIYQEIAENTNLLRKSFKPNTSFKNPTYNNKFKIYLSNLLPPTMLDKSGSGLPKFMIARQKEYPLDLRYWDDPNELVDRLRLLIAERSAGNNNHDNEIHAIVEELREAKIIF